MSRNGYLFNLEQIRDTDDHYGTSSALIGSGSGEGGHPGGSFAALGAFRDSTVSFLNVGTEDIVNFTTTNTLDVSVTITYEGFIGSASQAEVQTLDFGNIATYAYGPDLNTQGDPEFISQVMPLRGDDKDARTNTNTVQVGSAIDEPYDVPGPSTFTLTFGGATTPLVMYSTNMSSDIQDALLALNQFVDGDLVVTKTSLSVYVVTFGGNYANEDVSAITITDVNGFVATGVTQTRQGGTLVDLTDPTKWEGIGAPEVVAAGNTAAVVVNPNVHNKIRAKATAAGVPASGGLTLSWTSSRGASVFAGI